MIGRSGERESGISVLAARHHDDIYIYIYKEVLIVYWLSGYHHSKWARQLEFKSWTNLFAFHIVPIPLRRT